MEQMECPLAQNFEFYDEISDSKVLIEEKNMQHCANDPELAPSGNDEQHQSDCQLLPANCP